MSTFRCLLFLVVSTIVASSASAQVNIIEADPNIEFIDMGYDVDNDEVGIVGNVVNPNDPNDLTATVFEFNATRDGFVGQTLADLPGATSKAEVNKISSDAFRIAGVSSSADAIDIEGTTWLRLSPSNPTGIGFIAGTPNNSTAVGAWSNGVVGDSGNASLPTIWTQNTGLQELTGTGISVSQAQDVNSNGDVVVGYSGHEVIDGAAYFWDSSGIQRLNDAIGGHTLFNSRAKSISPNASFIAGEIAAFDSQSNFQVFAAAWEGVNRNLRVIEDASGVFIEGTTTDVSDNGFAIGVEFDAAFNASGFIYHESLGHAVNFNDYLLSLDPSLQFDFELLPNAIHWDELSNTLRFTATGADEGSFFIETQFNAVPEPSAAFLVVSLGIGFSLRRRRMN